MTPQLRDYFLQNPRPLYNFLKKTLDNPGYKIIMEAEEFEIILDDSQLRFAGIPIVADRLSKIIKIICVKETLDNDFYGMKMSHVNNKLTWNKITPKGYTVSHFVRNHLSGRNLDLSISPIGNSNNQNIQVINNSVMQNMHIETRGENFKINFCSYKLTRNYQDVGFSNHDQKVEKLEKMSLLKAIIYLAIKAEKDINFGWKTR